MTQTDFAPQVTHLEDFTYIWTNGGTIAIVTAVMPDFWKLPPGFFFRGDIELSRTIQPNNRQGKMISISDNHGFMLDYRPFSELEKWELRHLKPRQKYMMQIAEKTGWYCYYCGLPLLPLMGIVRFFDQYGDRYLHEHGRHNFHFPYDVEPEMEHVIPRRQGGKSNMSNLVLSCSGCNGEKGSLSYWEFVDRLWTRAGGIGGAL